MTKKTKKQNKHKQTRETKPPTPTPPFPKPPEVLIGIAIDGKPCPGYLILTNYWDEQKGVGKATIALKTVLDAGIGMTLAPKPEQDFPGYSHPLPHTPEWGLLVDEVDFLRRAIDRRKPGGNDIYQVMQDVLSYRGSIETEDDHPDASAFVAALDKFYALPEATRRDLLSGWTMDRWPALKDVAGSGTYQPMLTITPCGRNPNGAAHADHQLVLEDELAPVHLHIVAGTTKRKALDAVWDLWHLIETQWPTMTAIDPMRALDEPLPVVTARVEGRKPPPHWLLDRPV